MTEKGVDNDEKTMDVRAAGCRYAGQCPVRLRAVVLYGDERNRPMPERNPRPRRGIRCRWAATWRGRSSFRESREDISDIIQNENGALELYTEKDDEIRRYTFDGQEWRREEKSLMEGLEIPYNFHVILGGDGSRYALYPLSMVTGSA